MRGSVRRCGFLVMAAILAVECGSVRARPAVAARPAGSSGAHAARQVEQASPPLAAALARLSAEPSAAHEIDVARAYLEQGIQDQAFDHFERASRLDPAEGAAWEGLARLWRDWGFPHMGLGDAYRAVATAPDSASAHNTLGTVLQMLARGADARRSFARALSIDPTAAYALHNLCRSWTKDGRPEPAPAWCGSTGPDDGLPRREAAGPMPAGVTSPWRDLRTGSAENRHVR